MEIRGRDPCAEEDLLSKKMRKALESRKSRGLVRQLTLEQSSCLENDFGSNDYLGLARSEMLRGTASKILERYQCVNGSTGSRLVTGNSQLAEDVEELAAKFHNSESAVLFNSGFNANHGLLGCLASKDDAILWDERCHASSREGTRVTNSSHVKAFRHNDLDSLHKELTAALERVTGAVIIVVESLYSMDGDLVPLKRLFKRIEFGGRRVSVVIDEAHTVGLYGGNGSGYVCERGFENHPNLLARVVSLGKAFGCHGGFVLGSRLLRDYLLNYARPLIFSSALPKSSLATILGAYEAMDSTEIREKRARVFTLSEYLRSEIDASPVVRSLVMTPMGTTNICSLAVVGAEFCVWVADQLALKGFRVMAVRPPTVSPGTERIRITVHSHNVARSIRELVRCLEEIILTADDGAVLPSAAKL
ncbi:hypothetical protein NDN08_007917 [Rhodosorus marinus]|uniref:Aminotransferase class I/classII large domain-containing protein n=1 Tax=Rhodosorus marinus TaxID=101924 RepID=A0AAV8V1Q3_9RHOD|nr:hypothetical protein NDN08_007917 [Rhodosorus marinus]